jgi:hypothetical protein
MQERPFTTSFMLCRTLKDIHKLIDRQLSVTIRRIEEFDGNQAKSKEIFVTLSALQGLRDRITAFQAENPELFEDHRNEL